MGAASVIVDEDYSIIKFKPEMITFKPLGKGASMASRKGELKFEKLALSSNRDNNPAKKVLD